MVLLNDKMNLTSIIIDYLAEHRRLVIPSLGAFIRKSETQEVVFSEMLKRDDGVLRGLLAEQGMGEIEAAGAIDRFIFELRCAIDNNSVFQAEGLGVFARGENGTIRFRYLPAPTSESEPHSEAQPEPVVHNEPQSAPQPEVAEPAELVAESEPLAEPEPQPEPESLADEQRNRIKELMRFSDEHPREHRSSSQPRRPDPSVRGLRYGKPQKTTDAYTYVNSAPSRRPDTFIILAVLAVVIALGAIIYGYWNDRRKEQLEAEQYEFVTPAENPFAGEQPVE